MSEKYTPEEPADSISANDVERVLEHVSSLFRSELLDIPEAQPGSIVPKKTGHQKSDSI